MAIIEVVQEGSWKPIGGAWVPEYQRGIIPKEPGVYQLRPVSQVWLPYASSAFGGRYEAIYDWVAGVTLEEEWPDIRELPEGSMEVYHQQQTRLGALSSGI